MEPTDEHDAEAIEAFLVRLKLPEKYLECFLHNGYQTVEDCKQLDEQILKDMGITLRGHYRRILSQLSGSSVRKPPRKSRLKMSAENDNGLKQADNEGSFQTQVSNTQLIAHAQILQTPVTELEIPEIGEDTYATFRDYTDISLEVQEQQFPTPPRPLTPALIDSSEYDRSEHENPYETSIQFPPPPPQDDDFPPFIPPPLPTDGFSFDISESEDPYLTETHSAPAIDSSREHMDEEELNSYNSLSFVTRSSPEKLPHFEIPGEESEESIYCSADNMDSHVFNKLEDEDEYDHLKGPKDRSSLPQSPNCISSAMASIFPPNPAAQNGLFTQTQSAEVECEYDKLNSDSTPPYHQKLSRQNSPSYLSPPSSDPQSRRGSATTETIQLNPVDKLNSRTESRPRQFSDPDKSSSARDMPLPPPPWKTVIEDRSSNQNHLHHSPQEKAPLKEDSATFLTSAGESDYWAGDEPPSTTDEGSYDILDLNKSGKTNYNSKSLITRTTSVRDDTGDESVYDYEVVEFTARQDRLEIQSKIPPVPHNTPSRTSDDTPCYNDDDDEDPLPSSYEEVEFFPKNKAPVALETAVYSGIAIDTYDRGRSMTLNAVNPKEKPKGLRRLTAVQTQLHKAKAAMSKHKKKKDKEKVDHVGLEGTVGSYTSTASDDNESVDSLSSRRSSNEMIHRSLDDLNNVTGLPPTPHSKHQRQPSDSVVRSSDSPLSGIKQMSRKSPVERRKRVTSNLDIAGSNEDTYEIFRDDIDSRRPNGPNGFPIAATRARVQKARENLSRRPVSVFVDSNYPLDFSDQDGRGRTYSATLKREPNTSSSNIDDDFNPYADIGEIMPAKPIPVVSMSPSTKKRTKSGWLWKQGGHEGRAPLRKRWVVFDGDEMAYYESDSKTEFSKGIIPVDVMLRVQVPPNDSLIFHVQTKGGRKYIFQAETSDERTMWTSTLMAAIMIFEQNDRYQFKPGGSMYMPYKEGHLKMEGIRQKVYLAIKGEHTAYYKSKKEFSFAQPVARLQMKLATVKDVDKKKFQVVFPYKTFTFTADSEEEKKSWIEPLLEAIAEGLSDYKVLNEIWENEANKKCADCGRMYPDWASINLAIVVCKHCAGVHRELGVHNSKVRSLKMDIRIWDSTMKRLLLDIGNGEANKFWASNISSSEAITDMADKEQRSWFIKAKYIEMKYVKNRNEQGDQSLLNQHLIEAVRSDNLLEAYQLTFSGADLNCFTGKEQCQTPQLLAEYLTYNTLAEFLKQNGATGVTSPEGHITDRNTSVRKKDSFSKTHSKPPVCLKDLLFKYGGDFKGTGEDTKTKGKFKEIISALQPGDFQKRLCFLEENVLKYCDPEKPSIMKDYISCKDLMSITVHTPEQAVKAGYKHCFELSRTSGRTYLFCADREDTRKRWTRGLMQAIVPPYIQDGMQCEEEYDRIGKIKIKAKKYSKTSSEWSSTWCRLRKKKLQYFHNDSRAMETIDLRKLVQITVDQTQEMPSNQANTTQSKETIPVIMLVFRDKSYYLHSDTRPDTESWMAALRRSDNESGSTLEEKQLTAEGVPIVLEKCITYVEQFGITMRGIYRLSGTHSKTTQLLNDFRQNARDTQMREGDMNVHDVANALKRWFKSLPGSLLTEQLHEQWIETAQIRPEHRNTKLEWYKHLIERLPEINRVTLKVLLMHLKNVSSHHGENEMSFHNIAIVFGPTLMEPQQGDSAGPRGMHIGQTEHEIACIEDLLQYYDWLFDVTDTDREKERMMQLAKEKISMAKQQQNMLTTLDYDMMVPIYINKKEDKCVNYKVNLCSDELVTKVCRTHGYPEEKWGLYEVIQDGDAERPLHYSEHVLGVIKSWSMPSTNYLVAKNDYIRDKMKWFKQSAPSNADTIMEGNLKVFDGKKKWSKASGSIARRADGTVHFTYTKTSAPRSTISMEVTTFKVYVGVDKKTKPPGNGKQGFTILHSNDAPKLFIAETEGELYRWVSHMLLSMHPEGFTPPVSNKNTPVKALEPETAPRGMADKISKRNVYGSISQQELGAAVAKVATELKRTSSNESTGSIRERYQDIGRQSSPSPAYYSPTQGPHSPNVAISIPEGAQLYTMETSMEDVYDLHRPRNSSSSSGELPPRPNQLQTEPQPRRPVSHFALSPVDPRNHQRAGLGIQLRDELSNVLRKRAH